MAGLRWICYAVTASCLVVTGVECRTYFTITPNPAYAGRSVTFSCVMPSECFDPEIIEITRDSSTGDYISCHLKELKRGGALNVTYEGQPLCNENGIFVNLTASRSMNGTYLCKANTPKTNVSCLSNSVVLNFYEPRVTGSYPQCVSDDVSFNVSCTISDLDSYQFVAMMLEYSRKASSTILAWCRPGPGLYWTPSSKRYFEEFPSTCSYDARARNNEVTATFAMRLSGNVTASLYMLNNMVCAGYYNTKIHGIPRVKSHARLDLEMCEFRNSSMNEEKSLHPSFLETAFITIYITSGVIVAPLVIAGIWYGFWRHRKDHGSARQAPSEYSALNLPAAGSVADGRNENNQHVYECLVAKV